MNLPPHILASPRRVEITNALVERDNAYSTLESVQSAYTYYAQLEEKYSNEIREIKEKGKITFNILDEKANNLMDEFNDLNAKNSEWPELDVLNSIWTTLEKYYERNKLKDSSFIKNLIEIGLIENKKDLNNLALNVKKLLAKHNLLCKSNLYDFNGFVVDDDLTIKDLKRRIKSLKEKSKLEQQHAESLKTYYMENMDIHKKIICKSSIIL